MIVRDSQILLEIARDNPTYMIAQPSWTKIVLCQSRFVRPDQKYEEASNMKTTSNMNVTSNMKTTSNRKTTLSIKLTSNVETT